MVLRSFIFAPADHTRRVEKALALDVDAVILDLEDAVAATRKPAARASVVAALGRPRTAGRAYVRVNAMDTAFCYADLVAVVGAGLDGIVLPKVETASALLAADWLLTQLEREAGLAAGHIDLLPILETGRGLDNVREIARAGSRVKRLAFGAGDFTFDMNMLWSEHERELEYARATILTASKAAGLEPPIDSVWVRLGDETGLRRSARHVADIGFQGKLCIHPSQVPVLNEVFSPGADEVREAHRIVDAFRSAEEEGVAALQLDGKFIDYPIYYRALAVLERAEACVRRAAEVDAHRQGAQPARVAGSA